MSGNTNRTFCSITPRSPGTAFSHAWSLCVEAQFYLLLPPLLLLLARHRLAAVASPFLLVLAGMTLRGALAWENLNAEGEMPARAFQTLIYYATWTRLDPLVLGVSLAAVERLRPRGWAWLMGAAPWLWAPGLVVVALGAWLGEGERTVAVCVGQFPLVALGMGALLLAALSPRLPPGRRPVPGAAFGARVAYSVYLSHKLVIHGAAALCVARGLE